MSVPRSDRQPTIARAGATSILCIGDVHFVSPGFMYSERASKLRDDVNRMLGLSQVHAVVQMGDQTTNALAVEYDAYLAWRAGFALPSGVQFRQIAGNHDLIGPNAPGTADVVTTAQWATKMGVAAKDAVLDIGSDVRLLLLSPTATSTGALSAVTRLYLDAADIAWCDARMSETTRRCLILTHAPLWHTVGPLDGSGYSSYAAGDLWITHPRADVEAMIARHPNCVGWVSSHTHSPLGTADIVRSVTYGSVTIAAINASSPAFLNPYQGVLSTISSALVTVLPDRIEVRFRDHGAGQWLAPVRTVML